MPIYAYKCSACDHAQDVLQKMSDPLLTDCPQCGKSTYVKQVTAAAFQLKGSGWYVTDFRDGGKSTGDPAVATGSTESSASPESPAPSTASSDTSTSAPSSGTTSVAAPTPAAAT